jgi:hypothetical protein
VIYISLPLLPYPDDDNQQIGVVEVRNAPTRISAAKAGSHVEKAKAGSEVEKIKGKALAKALEKVSARQRLGQAQNPSASSSIIPKKLAMEVAACYMYASTACQPIMAGPNAQTERRQSRSRGMSL